MELLALLSNRDNDIIPGVKNALRKYTIYPLKAVGELEDLYSNIPLNLLIIDTSSYKLSSVEHFLDKLDEEIVILVTPEALDRFVRENLPRCVFGCVEIESLGAELPRIVERALEKQRYRHELKFLKQSREHGPEAHTHLAGKPADEVISNRYDSAAGGRYMQEKIIVNFAKMLSVSFDMRRLFDHFMDSVMEIARVSKMSVLLRNQEGFSIKTHYGLDPYIADNLTLGKDSALAACLSKSARIVHCPSAYIDSSSMHIKKEMELLQCSCSFPMIHKGKLIGIFNINNKITEGPFYREELEIIYVLCNYLAAAVKDINLHHRMWYQKEFTNNILSSMTSGMIAIDKTEKITIFNQLASEILELDASEIIGKDLRALPSPLGDILFETMETGNSYKRHEVEIRPSGLPLGINSYRLLDEKHNPIGAGIVFSDLSDSKKLEEQSRRTEKLRAVNELMAKIAHEVRNPLTSIQTYTQLLNEKYVDDDLYNFYISTVSGSIRRLDSLIDKLVSFSNTQDYHLTRQDLGDIIEEAATYIFKNIPPTHKFTRHMNERYFRVDADKKHLIKAFYYLVLSIIDRTPDGVPIAMRVHEVADKDASVAIVISYEGDKIIEDGDEKLFKQLIDINNLGKELNVPISYKIIEGHNGSLEVKSEEGINSFIVKLPIAESDRSKISVKEGEARG